MNAVQGSGFGLMIYFAYTKDLVTLNNHSVQILYLKRTALLRETTCRNDEGEIKMVRAGGMVVIGKGMKLQKCILFGDMQEKPHKICSWTAIIFAKAGSLLQIFDP